MVMAAGLGKRMRPLTATRPKPLVEVAGKALIDHVLDRLRAAGVEEVVVNVHYLADALEAHLAARCGDLGVTISDERSLLLETGGGLVQAAPMIAEDTFLVVNSDNYWIDGPADSLRLLASQWREEEMDALLLLVPTPAPATTMAPAISAWIRRSPAPPRPRSRRALRLHRHPDRLQAPPPRRSDGPFLDQHLLGRAIEEGRCFGAVHQGLWFDVGSPPAIAATEAALTHA
jgi:MurNAc alpha-1-phosphate uridylyltransferase